MFDAGHSSKDIKILEPNGYVKEEPRTVSVMLMKSMIVKIRGEVTGNQYIFNGGGSIVQVDEKDIQGIIKNNNRRQSCCGSYSTPYFSLV